MAQIAKLRRRVGWAATLLFCMAPSIGRTQAPSEYQVKAAYLYGFGRFVDWPPSAPANAGRAFSVCVLGTDPFGRALDEVTANAVMKDKPVQIRRIASAEAAADCHTVFVSAVDDIRLGRILEVLAGSPVLTVSDAPQFAQRGGVVGFLLEGNRVRFTVNLGAARRAGLVLNSELLRVSASVIGNRQEQD
jgi:hypothetical protein